MTPPVVVFRSIFRDRLLYAAPGWLLRETAQQIVTATVPGAETRQLVGPRHDVLPAIAAGRERTAITPWRTNRVLWVTPLGAAHALGHFWDHTTGVFTGYYVNLQTPVRRSPYGFDALDHVLDIVVSPSGAWRWKDEDEFEQAVTLGLFTDAEAVEIRAEGERVIGSLPDLLPTGWEDWLPDASWSLESLKLPGAVREIDRTR
jgi:hypothetical protein